MSARADLGPYVKFQTLVKQPYPPQLLCKEFLREEEVTVDYSTILTFEVSNKTNFKCWYMYFFVYTSEETAPLLAKMFIGKAGDNIMALLEGLNRRVSGVNWESNTADFEGKECERVVVYADSLENLKGLSERVTAHFTDVVQTRLNNSRAFRVQSTSMFMDDIDANAAAAAAAAADQKSARMQESWTALFGRNTDLSEVEEAHNLARWFESNVLDSVNRLATTKFEPICRAQLAHARELLKLLPSFGSDAKTRSEIMSIAAETLRVVMVMGNEVAQPPPQPQPREAYATVVAKPATKIVASTKPVEPTKPAEPTKAASVA